jgi:hypothetical protein
MQMILHQSGVAVVSQNQSGIQGNRNTTARSLKAIQYCPSRLAFASKPPVGGCFTYQVTKALDARRKPGPSTTHRPTRGGDRSAMDKTARIRELNDNFRRTFSGGRVLMSKGVSALADEDKTAVLDKVLTFESFRPRQRPAWRT